MSRVNPPAHEMVPIAATAPTTTPLCTLVSHLCTVGLKRSNVRNLYFTHSCMLVCRTEVAYARLLLQWHSPPPPTHPHSYRLKSGLVQSNAAILAACAAFVPPDRRAILRPVKIRTGRPVLQGIAPDKLRNNMLARASYHRRKAESRVDQALSNLEPHELLAGGAGAGGGAALNALRSELRDAQRGRELETQLRRLNEIAPHS